MGGSDRRSAVVFRGRFCWVWAAGMIRRELWSNCFGLVPLVPKPLGCRAGDFYRHEKHEGHKGPLRRGVSGGGFSTRLPQIVLSGPLWHSRFSIFKNAERAAAFAGDTLPGKCSRTTRRTDVLPTNAPETDPIHTVARTAVQIRSTSASVRSGWIGSARIRAARSSETGNATPSCWALYAGCRCSGLG